MSESSSISVVAGLSYFSPSPSTLSLTAIILFAFLMVAMILALLLHRHGSLRDRFPFPRRVSSRLSILNDTYDDATVVDAELVDEVVVVGKGKEATGVDVEWRAAATSRDYTPKSSV